MISNPTPKFTSQIRSIRSVFGRNRTGTGSEKIDRIDRNRNRNRISGRTLLLGPSKLVIRAGYQGSVTKCRYNTKKVIFKTGVHHGVTSWSLNIYSQQRHLRLCNELK